MYCAAVFNNDTIYEKLRDNSIERYPREEVRLVLRVVIHQRPTEGERSQVSPKKLSGIWNRHKQMWQRRWGKFLSNSFTHKLLSIWHTGVLSFSFISYICFETFCVAQLYSRLRFGSISFVHVYNLVFCILCWDVYNHYIALKWRCKLHFNLKFWLAYDFRFFFPANVVAPKAPHMSLILEILVFELFNWCKMRDLQTSHLCEEKDVFLYKPRLTFNRRASTSMLLLFLLSVVCFGWLEYTIGEFVIPGMSVVCARMLNMQFKEFSQPLSKIGLHAYRANISIAYSFTFTRWCLSKKCQP